MRTLHRDAAGPHLELQPPQLSTTRSELRLVLLLASTLTQGWLDPQTRQGLLEKELDAKAASLKEWQPGKADQMYLRTLKNPVVKGFLTLENGGTVRFGGPYPDSGFAVGP